MNGFEANQLQPNGTYLAKLGEGRIATQMVESLGDKRIRVGTFPVPVFVIQVLDDVKDIKELSRMGAWNVLETALLERFEHPRWYGEPAEDQ